MKSSYCKFVFVFVLFITALQGNVFSQGKTTFFTADNPNFKYVGRIDFSNTALPRFWQPGVYITAQFSGASCEFTVNDEVPYETAHNYISYQVDNLPARRLKLTQKVNVIKIGEKLSEGKHTLTICKGTEAGIGYVEFVGIRCKKLLNPQPLPTRKIEFYGNSITCGAGSDLSEIPCDKAEWYDQNNAFLSYGSITSRTLNAQWMLSSVSGIGLVHSCCNMDIVMPDVFDKINMRSNQVSWDFSRYQPDVVTIALGQNDGIQDSAFFCSKYVEFLRSMRSKYPSSTFVCLTSPMADAALTAAMKKYLTSVVGTLNGDGDKNVYSFFFSRSYNNGCGGHPDLAQHIEIAKELSEYLKRLKNW